MSSNAGSGSACCGRRKAAAGEPGPAPAWGWFSVTNLIAAAVFTASMTHLMSFWLAHMRTHSAAFAFAQPWFAVSVAGAVASLLYFIAFCGVAFIHSDVEQMTLGTGNIGAAPIIGSVQARDVDADVVIVGCGTAGASLATQLARQGKRVTVIERTFVLAEKIIGELMQPGGVRCLERMGLSEAAKGAETGSIHVEGYVCITPGGGKGSDLVLTYPSADPSSLKEYFGMMMEEDRRAVNVNADYEATAATSAAISNTTGGTHSVAPDAGAEFAARAAADVECPVTGTDKQPRGRSFWYHKFVHQLRKLMLGQPGITTHVGTVRRLIYARDILTDSSIVAGRSTVANPACTPPLPPTFAGFDADDQPIAYSGPRAPEGGAGAVAPGKRCAWPAGYASLPADTVVGVAWTDEAGNERITLARLSVVADGYYSTFRSSLHTESKPQPVSYFCGLVLNHPPGQRYILPYPHRGHVVMADPNPVLLYQISSTQTRVLVDMPCAAFHEANKADGGLRAYFRDVVAPQLPECVRGPFLDANATQEPQCMGCRPLNAAPPQKPGAILLGDAWNVRHPLTGGGMTVALKDSEAVANALAGVHFGAASDYAIAAAIRGFQERRAAHAATINVLANALHKVFTRPLGDPKDGTRSRLRAACIDYLSLGGAHTAGPVGLLSGLTPKPEVLVAHFFWVAVHAMRHAVVPYPTPGRLRKGYDLLHVACCIIMPLLAAERVTLLANPLVAGVTDLVFPWKKSPLAE